MYTFPNITLFILIIYASGEKNNLNYKAYKYGFF